MSIVRLGRDQRKAFRAVREEGLASEPEHFRYSPLDDCAISDEAWARRLEREFVVGYFREDVLCGIGGFARGSGAKLNHKGLIWGMYVRPSLRGGEAADAIMSALLREARSSVALVQLTVMERNLLARAFYERHGFRVYGVEPAAARQGRELENEALMWLPLSPQARVAGGDKL